MNKDTLDLLLNDYYKTLKVLYENQIKLDNDIVLTPLTQVEVAEKIGVSKITMNCIFKELQRYKLIDTYKGKRGIYKLSDSAQTILEELGRINKYIEERKKQ